MKYMTNMAPAKISNNMLDKGAKANELKNFYCRFEVKDFSQDHETELDALSVSDSFRINIDQHMVGRLFHVSAPARHLGQMASLGDY